jgi:hypothetical protein
MDNRHFTYGCPGLMQDARFITNYYQNRTFEQNIRNVNKIENSHDYRAFLQTNAESIMNNEHDFLVKSNTCAVDGKCVALSNPVDDAVAKGVCKWR